MPIGAHGFASKRTWNFVPGSMRIHSCFWTEKPCGNRARIRWLQPAWCESGCDLAEVHCYQLDESCWWAHDGGQAELAKHSHDRDVGMWGCAWALAAIRWRYGNLAWDVLPTLLNSCHEMLFMISSILNHLDSMSCWRMFELVGNKWQEHVPTLWLYSVSSLQYNPC